MASQGSGDGTLEKERERRAVREGYRKIDNELRTHMEETEKSDPVFLNKKLDDTSKLFTKVSETPEAVMDSNIMNTIALLAQKNVGSLRPSYNTFTPMGYAEKLLQMFAIDVSDDPNKAPDIPKDKWVELGKEMAPKLRRVASFHPLYATFETGEIEAKKRVARRPREKDEDTKAVQPKKLTSTERSQADLTEEEVQKVLQTLNKVYTKRGGKAIGYFEFVTDPLSFGQTVENIFHVSFLIKDNLAKMSMDKNGFPILEPTRSGRGESSDMRAETGVQQQNIINVTMADWRKIVDTFQIKCAIIQK